MAAPNQPGAAWASGLQFAPLSAAWRARVLATRNGRATTALSYAPANGRYDRQAVTRQHIRDIMRNNWQAAITFDIAEMYLIMLCRFGNEQLRTTKGICTFYTLAVDFFLKLRPAPHQFYHAARRDLELLGIEGKKLLKVKYLLLVAEVPVPNTPAHGFLIVISGVNRLIDCYDSWNVNRRPRMVQAMTRLVNFLSFQLGVKFVPEEWKMRFRDTAFQGPTSMDCAIHICTLAMCVIYNWLPNYGVMGPGGENLLAQTIRRKRERLAAELMNADFTGDFDYSFPLPYPPLPLDALGYHQLWNVVTRTLPDDVQRRKAVLVGMIKAQLTAFCEQEPGIGIGPNAHPSWISWKRMTRDFFIRNIEQRLYDRGIEDAEEWAQANGLL